MATAKRRKGRPDFSAMTIDEKVRWALTHASPTVEMAYELPPVPECRRVSPGDEVEVGNLTGCVVLGTSNDLRTVVVECDGDESPCIRAWPWHGVIPKGAPAEESGLVRERIVSAYLSTDLDALLGTVLRRGLIDNPDYQRGYVWTSEDKQRYIESVFEDRDLGKFVFVDYDHPEYRLEVLDGKQRLSALLDFYLSRLPYHGRYWHQYSKLERAYLGSRNLQYVQLRASQYTKSQLLKLFLDINTGGVPQTEEHIAHVRKLYDQAVSEEGSSG